LENIYKEYGNINFFTDSTMEMQQQLSENTTGDSMNVFTLETCEFPKPVTVHPVNRQL
jgi:hypothetical protein